MMKYILVLALAVLFNGCTKEEKIVKKDEAVKNVFISFAIPKTKDEDRVFSGIASANHQTNLSFKVQGNINYFKYQMGDEIKKGELIAKLDAKPYELKVSQINYALSEAKAGLLNAKSSYERTKKLYINQNASVSDIDKIRATYDSANAKVKNIKEELSYAKLQLSYTKLYSPMNGYISVKYVQENENISTGTPIVLISDKLVDEVKVQVPETTINKIEKDDTVNVIFASLDTKNSFNAKVSEISKFASQNSKTYTVVVKLPNSSSQLKSGMSADVYFNLSAKSKNDIFYVPSNSVLNDDAGYFVYVVEKGFIKRKNVLVKELTSNGYEVKHGITLDDMILKAGMSEVYEGMQVKVGNLKELGK